MRVFYWSPHISEVATIYAVINSTKSLNKYSKKFKPTILNAVGEWDQYRQEIEKEGINIINLLPFSIYSKLPRYTFFKSRMSYVIIFLISLLPLYRILKKEKPEYMMCHLISSLPLFLFNMFNFDTKLILRISGLPKLNFIRKKYWQISEKNIYKIFCPTLYTRDKLSNDKIFSNKKLFFLPDPIVEIKKYITRKKQSNYLHNKNEKLIIGIGRLTKQKNFTFLIKCFAAIKQEFRNENYKLIIIGEGEEREKLHELILKLNLNKYVRLVGYKKNVYEYLKFANCFILSSLWEDPGFVLIESALSSTPIISSDCTSGPIELLRHLENGLLFKSNNIESFMKTFIKFREMDSNLLKNCLYNAKKLSKQYTIFSHHNYLSRLLNT